MICASGKVCLGAQTSAQVLRRYLASVREARWWTGGRGDNSRGTGGGGERDGSCYV